MSQTFDAETQPIIDFWYAYQELSKQGKCDGVGGAESLRVFGEWYDGYWQSETETLEHYIIRRANAGLVGEHKLGTFPDAETGEPTEVHVHSSGLLFRR